jgi:hypothetical protein
MLWAKGDKSYFYVNILKKYGTGMFVDLTEYSCFIYVLQGIIMPVYQYFFIQILQH